MQYKLFLHCVSQIKFDKYCNGGQVVTEVAKALTEKLSVPSRQPLQRASKSGTVPQPEFRFTPRVQCVAALANGADPIFNVFERGLKPKQAEDFRSTYSTPATYNTSEFEDNYW